MPGVKISELATTTVLDGSELFTMVQNGMNRNTTRSTIIQPAFDAIDATNADLTSLNTAFDALNTTVTGFSDTINQLGIDLDTNVTSLSSSIIQSNVEITSNTTRINSLSAEHEQDIDNIVSQLGNVSSSSAAGAVFITNIINLNGVIQTKYQPNTVPSNYVIESITSDTLDRLRVTLEWDGPSEHFTGYASVNGVAIPSTDITRIGSTRRFTGTIDVDATNATGLTAVAAGATNTVAISSVGAGPSIVDVTFGDPPSTGGYQPSMFLNGDTVTATITFNTSDVDAIETIGQNFATASEYKNVTVSGNPPQAVVQLTIDTDETTTTDLPVKIFAYNKFGTAGDEFTTTETIPVRVGPEVLSVTFGSYPGTQTELKNNDTIQASIEFDTNDVTRVDFVNSSSYANDGTSYSVTPSNRIAVINMRIGASNTTVQSLPVRLRARGGSSNNGEYKTSTNTLDVNNVYPAIGNYSVSYPGGNSALKGTEEASVTMVVTNAGNSPVYSYTSPTNELTINSPSSYLSPKPVVCRNPKTYNISNNNIRLSVTRTENNAVTVYNNNVKIVDKAPTLTVSLPATRLRSGGNDGTTQQQYTVTVQSDQQLRSFNMTNEDDAGALDGTWSGSSNNTRWTRKLLVHDDHLKGSFNWTNVAATGLSNITQNTINSGASYTLGGFVMRTLTIPSQGWQAQANVIATDYSKVNAVWSKKNLTTRASLGDISRPQVATWSLNRLSPAPLTVSILDSGATLASSQPSTLTLEEQV